MKKYTSYIFIVAVAVFFAAYPFKSASAETGLYIGGWGGYTIGTDAGTYEHHDYYDVDLDIEETSVWGVKFGYSNPYFKYLEVEAEYSYLNPDINNYAINGDVKINNFMFNVIGRYPRGMIQPYIGIGYGFSYSDMSLKDVRRVNGDDYTSYAWQLLTGAELYLTRQIAIDVGYRYYVTDMEFEYTYPEDITFSASMITLGLKVFF